METSTKPAKSNFFFQGLKGIYDVKNFKRLREKSISRAFLFLFMLCFITSLIGALYLSVEFHREAKGWLESLPEFTLTQEGLEVNTEMPIIKEEEGVLFVVDTTGKIDKTVLADYKQGFFISKTALFYKKSEVETREINFRELEPGMVITKETVVDWLGYLWIIVLVIFVFALLFTFIGKIISALIMGLIGLIANKTMGTKFKFAELFKLGAYALALPILIQFVLWLIGIQVPVFFLIYYGVATIFLVRAMKYLDSVKVKPTEPETGETATTEA